MAESAERLVSLDVFRGMTIAGMVLVNNPGTWSAIYGPLKHADWHGITPTDYIFPFFLFIVGVAVPIAFSKRIAAGITCDTYVKIFARSATIFAVGWRLVWRRTWRSRSVIAEVSSRDANRPDSGDDSAGWRRYVLVPSSRRRPQQSRCSGRPRSTTDSA